MGRSRSKLLSPTLLFGLGVSVAVAFGASLLARSVEHSVAIAIFGIGVAVSIGLDLLARSELDAMMAARPWLRREILDLVRAASDVAERRDTALDESLRRVLEEALGRARDLANGRFRGTDFNIAFLVQRAMAARTSIRGVTNMDGLVEDGRQWWRSTAGTEYLEANIDQAARGVSVERIVIYGTLEEGVRQFIEKQLSGGIRVLTVPRDRVPSNLRREFVVWDETASWETEMNADGQAISYSYSAAPSDAHRLLDTYRSLREIASAYETDATRP